MNGLFHAALEVQEFCRQKKWQFCFIGGIAVMRWGQPRMTQDVDASIFCEFGEEEPIIDELLAQFSTRISAAREFALDNRILLLKTVGHVSIDLALASLPFEQEMMRRATFWQASPEISLKTCSAEDLIVMKAFAERPQDLLDVESIVERNRSLLSRQYIENWLSVLYAETGIPDTAARLIRRIDSE